MSVLPIGSEPGIPANSELDAVIAEFQRLVRDPGADLGHLCVQPIASDERVGWCLYVE